MDGLFCGYGNCAPELGYDPGVDCCYRPRWLIMWNWSELGYVSATDCCFDVNEKKGKFQK